MIEFMSTIHQRVASAPLRLLQDLLTVCVPPLQLVCVGCEVTRDEGEGCLPELQLDQKPTLVGNDRADPACRLPRLHPGYALDSPSQVLLLGIDCQPHLSHGLVLHDHVSWPKPLRNHLVPWRVHLAVSLGRALFCRPRYLVRRTIVGLQGNALRRNVLGIGLLLVVVVICHRFCLEVEVILLSADDDEVVSAAMIREPLFDLARVGPCVSNIP
mmetsp:Transcript_30980/g.62067  ORF Transcript_30980/g.62067 Transcript_30980/m.62067 type:complete len:214 (-) Transcript_30980:91-732(-)